MSSARQADSAQPMSGTGILRLKIDASVFKPTFNSLRQYLNRQSG